MKKTIIITAAALALASCSTSNDPLTGRPQVSKTVVGAGVGAAAGALAGLLIGKDKKGSDKRKSILIGAGVGALVGGGVGAYMDRQEEELRAQLRGSGVSVTRNGNELVLNMPSNVTFATDQSNLNPNFNRVLDSVAIILNKYPRTLLDIDGHTDSDGDAGYNQDLSERRAVSVGRYLASAGIDSRRLLVVGYGEERPIASNASASGKAQNRRVEVRISPIT